MYIVYTYRRKASVASCCPPSPYIIFSMTSEKNKTLQGLLSSVGVCGWMSRCGCEHISVQQLRVQVSFRFCSAEVRSFFLYPEGNGYQSLNLTYISHHISHFGHRHALLPALFVFFYHSCRGRTDYFI